MFGRHHLQKIANFVPRPVKRLLYRVQDGCVRLARDVQVNPRAIFVLGNHKAGTTAIASLLAKISGASIAVELRRQIQDPRYARVLNNELSFRDFVDQNKVDFSRDIVKDNHLTFLVPSLLAEFPECRCVLVVRDPRQNIRSILNRLDLPGTQRTSPSGFARRHNPGWQFVVDNSWLGIRESSLIEQLAQRWNLAADVYFARPQEFELVKYEDFAAAKQETVKRLAERLSLPCDYDISPWLDVQFQPRGNSAVDLNEFFGDEHLQRIETICGDRMARFGYPLSLPK